MPGVTLNMPAPPVLQYNAWEWWLPHAEPSRVHMVYSVQDELWHATLDNEAYFDPDADFTLTPVSDNVWYEGAEDYNSEDVHGRWTTAAPLWTADNLAGDPFGLEPMPAVAFDSWGVDFRRLHMTTSSDKGRIA
jgi:hypothetical protein